MKTIEKIRESFLQCESLEGVGNFFKSLDPKFEIQAREESLSINISKYDFIEVYLFSKTGEINQRAEKSMAGRLCQLAISKDFKNWYFARLTMEERLRVVKYRIEKDKIKSGKTPIALRRLSQLSYGKSESFYELFDRKDVSKRFYSEYTQKCNHLALHIKGIKEGEERRLYAQVLLNRIIFLYFLQKKNLLGKDERYLVRRFIKCKESKKSYYRNFLRPLFFDTICCKPEERKKATIEITGEDIPYLNGGLFFKHRMEEKYPKIDVDNDGFENVLDFFESWIWNVSENGDRNGDEIDPYVLGYIFENSLGENKSSGSYYTPPFLSGFLTRNTIHQHLLEYVEKIHTAQKPYDDVFIYIQKAPEGELIHFYEKLRTLSICDPACGSGQFLVEALHILAELHRNLIQRSREENLKMLSAQIQKDYPQASQLDDLSDYQIRRFIVSQNLYGVDLNKRAVEITKLRLFLGMCGSIKADLPEPLPNINYKIRSGNSLTGYLTFSGCDEIKIKLAKNPQNKTGKDKKNSSNHEPSYASQNGIDFTKSEELYKKRQRLIFEYQNCHDHDKALALRDEIDELGEELKAKLDKRLRKLVETQNIRPKSKIDFIDLNKDSSAKKELDEYNLSAKSLEPLYYDLEFYDIFQGPKNGFDVLLLNPPWEVWKPNSQEFFEQHLPNFRKLDKNEAKKKVIPFLKENAKTKKEWLSHNCLISALSSFYNKSGFYDKQGEGDTNLYKLFLERSYGLLAQDGSLGIVMPSGFYSDKGCAALRREFLEKAKVNFLYGFENRKGIFENVFRMFKFILFSLSRGQKARTFPVAFMLQTEEELDQAHKAAKNSRRLELTNEIIQKLNPCDQTFMEFRSQTDIDIAVKMARFPLLEEEGKGKWQPVFARGFDMTNKAHLFRKKAELEKIGALYDEQSQSWKDKKGNSYLPLYEGKMIWQYDSYYKKPRYWVKESEGSAAFPKKGASKNGPSKGDLAKVNNKVKAKEVNLPYQDYRLSFRDVSRNTDERTWVASLLPCRSFSGNSLQHLDSLSSQIKLFFLALANSFVMDYFIRQKVSMNLSKFIVFSCPFPRFASQDDHEYFLPIVERAAALVGTTAIYDPLLKEVFGKKASHTSHGLTDAKQRQNAKHEIDAMCAAIYGIEKKELEHILSTFPLVDEEIKKGVLAKHKKLGG